MVFSWGSAIPWLIGGRGAASDAFPETKACEGGMAEVPCSARATESRQAQGRPQQIFNHREALAQFQNAK